MRALSRTKSRQSFRSCPLIRKWFVCCCVLRRLGFVAFDQRPAEKQAFSLGSAPAPLFVPFNPVSESSQCGNRAFFSCRRARQVILLRSMNRTVSIIGGGRVGRTLGKCLRKLGWRIGAVTTRSDATSRAAVRAIGGGTAYSAITADALNASVVLLTTPDDLLATAAAELAGLGRGECRGKIVLHTSGALDRTVLKPLALLGAATGSLHPMQTFSGRNTPNLKGTIFAVEGDTQARRAAR